MAILAFDVFVLKMFISFSSENLYGSVWKLFLKISNFKTGLWNLYLAIENVFRIGCFLRIKLSYFWMFSL